jgi:hypothetical protein
VPSGDGPLHGEGRNQDQRDRAELHNQAERREQHEFGQRRDGVGSDQECQAACQRDAVGKLLINAQHEGAQALIDRHVHRACAGGRRISTIEIIHRFQALSLSRVDDFPGTCAKYGRACPMCKQNRTSLHLFMERKPPTWEKHFKQPRILLETGINHILKSSPKRVKYSQTVQPCLLKFSRAYPEVD